MDQGGLSPLLHARSQADPLYFMAFELLYWAGIRVGELLALVPDDFDLRRSELRITKSYQRIVEENE